MAYKRLGHKKLMLTRALVIAILAEAFRLGALRRVHGANRKLEKFELECAPRVCLSVPKLQNRYKHLSTKAYRLKHSKTYVLTRGFESPSLRHSNSGAYGTSLNTFLKIQPGPRHRLYRKTLSGNISFVVVNYADGICHRFDSYPAEANALEAAEKLAKCIDARDYVAAIRGFDSAIGVLIDYQGAP